MLNKQEIYLINLTLLLLHTLKISNSKVQSVCE